MFAFLKRTPLVSICIPAYKSQGFIQGTIKSALKQTVGNIEIIISNDGGHQTPDIDLFRSNKKIRVLDNRSRLGWVENSNFVLSQARGKYFMILPHDDVLMPQYLEECVRVLKQDRAAFAVYSDIETEHGVTIVNEVRGSLEARIKEVMLNRYNGYSYRAVMRRQEKNFQELRLKPNPPSDYCVDSTWILQQVCFGELRRVEKPLYWKKLGDHTTHAGWAKLPRKRLVSAWNNHCQQMGEIAASRLSDSELVSSLVSHRRDARRVKETPSYLKEAME